mmetsp:Transcript_22511/g.73143  ORF Transcript_22511/g.73143 Transcript_22511/m.73143 type:complete len:201 (+) Transcript_22511:471-1073(+)
MGTFQERRRSWRSKLWGMTRGFRKKPRRGSWLSLAGRVCPSTASFCADQRQLLQSRRRVQLAAVAGPRQRSRLSTTWLTCYAQASRRHPQMRHPSCWALAPPSLRAQCNTTSQCSRRRSSHRLSSPEATQPLQRLALRGRKLTGAGCASRSSGSTPAQPPSPSSTPPLSKYSSASSRCKWRRLKRRSRHGTEAAGTKSLI